MAHVYQVHTSDGRTYEVATDQHHDDHPEERFKTILLRIVEGSAGTVIGNVIVRFIYKGRR